MVIRRFSSSLLLPIISGLLLIVMVSCQPSGNYNRNYPIDRSGWNQDSVLLFNPTMDSGQHVGFTIDIRNNNGYPYQNLYLLLEISTPSNTTVRDTIETILFSPTGEFKGSAMLGTFSHQIGWMNRYIASDSGSYRIAIRQGMRIKSLPGIEDVGLRMDIINP